MDYLRAIDHDSFTLQTIKSDKIVSRSIEEIDKSVSRFTLPQIDT